jgi:hypothetical protein
LRNSSALVSTIRCLVPAGLPVASVLLAISDSPHALRLPFDGTRRFHLSAAPRSIAGFTFSEIR